jgi:hypothetical protein
VSDPSPGVVVVLGGSGAVGRAVAAELDATLGQEIVVTARDRTRARDVARAIGPGVTGTAFDADDPASVGTIVDRARLVVMCVERANPQIAQLCLARGVSYVDISASEPILAAIRRHDAIAVGAGATGLVSVGVAPGLTNLLARRCHDALPSATGVDLTLCFGLRGDAGPDSRRWIIDGLAAPPPATASVTVALPHFGRRRAAWFPFSDQHAMTSALGIPVTTRLCFESRLVTAAVFAGRRARLFSTARDLGAGPWLNRWLGRVRLGTDHFLVHARAWDGEGRTVETSVAGRGECRSTAHVAAAAARHVLSGSVPPGVHDLDEVVDTAAFLAEVGGALDVRDPVVLPATVGVSRR